MPFWASHYPPEWRGGLFQDFHPRAARPYSFMSAYRYRISPPENLIFEVGYFRKDDVWIIESYHADLKEAIRYTAHLNGEDIFINDETQDLELAAALAYIIELETLGHAFVKALEMGTAKLPQELANRLYLLMEYDFK